MKFQPLFSTSAAAGALPKGALPWQHDDRLTKITDMMKRDGLDAIVAFSRADHHVDWGDAVMLLSGLKPVGPSLVVLTCDGDSSLVLTPGWDLARARRLSRARTVQAVTDPGEGLAAVLDGLKGRVGVVDLGKMPHGFARSVRQRLAREVVDVTHAVFAAVERKTDTEIAYARKATEIAEDTLDYLLGLVQPGLAECDVAADLKGYSLELGADDNFMMFHAARHPEAVQPANRRRFEAGDLILAEVTPSFRGQFTQVCRTICVGQASATQNQKYELVARAMRAGIDRIAPGVPVRAICDAIDAVLSGAGYGAYCEPPYMNRRGHGLGSTSIRPGNVTLSNDTVLQPGMFFVVHPNQYIPEVGYLLCGEPVLVTETGYERLTRKPAELISAPI